MQTVHCQRGTEISQVRVSAADGCPLESTLRRVQLPIPYENGTPLAERSHPYTAQVGQVIRAEMKARGWTPEDLAESLGVKSATTVRRWLDGRTGLTFDRLVQIEHKLDLPRGYLLRHAGLVHDPRTAREWLEADPLLSDPEQRRLALMVYDACATESAGAAGSTARRIEPSPNIVPTKRRTRSS